eukprot:TRINITY_DN2633_c0_g1_i2.p1 TRINITY_DN2633_c0_g1~~TRINITY_DN2633_c0_g1_i2.p1  ORF type:complete len:279 (-),score=65.45 TRINITY_DN2633_c0_g1_i2:18-803(-)
MPYLLITSPFHPIVPFYLSSLSSSYSLHFRYFFHLDFSLFCWTLLFPFLQSWTVDSNSDGINEEIWYETEFDVASGQSIQDVQLILFLEYKLSSRVQLTMESMVVVNGQNAAGGGVLSFDGTLSFDQKSLLPPLGRRSIYNAKLFEEKNVTSVRDFNMANIIFNAYQRNDTTSLTPLITTWQPGPAGKPFTVRGVIRIPPTVHRYQPGVIETLKFAWIQYLSLALVFYWILDVIKRFAYTERLVEAHIKDPINLAMNRKRK